MLTLQAVEHRVAAVAELAWDGERAHGKRDALWADALEAIASGHPKPATLAAAALRTKDIGHAEWCA